MLCVKFAWLKLARWFWRQRRRTTDKFWSEKLTWAFGFDKRTILFLESLETKIFRNECDNLKILTIKQYICIKILYLMKICRLSVKTLKNVLIEKNDPKVTSSEKLQMWWVPQILAHFLWQALDNILSLSCRKKEYIKCPISLSLLFPSFSFTLIISSYSDDISRRRAFVFMGSLCKYTMLKYILVYR